MWRLLFGFPSGQRERELDFRRAFSHQFPVSHFRLGEGLRTFAGGFFLFQGGVDGGVGADFVIVAVGPAEDGEIFEIDARHAALAYHDFAEDIAIDWDCAAEETVFSFVR